MRSLQKNTRTIYYTDIQSYENIIDEDGFQTGEKRPKYNTPVALKVNISSNIGEIATKVFGDIANYSRTITISGKCPLKENTMIWFDIDTSEKPNYIVYKIADSKNETIIALQEVNRSE